MTEVIRVPVRATSGEVVGTLVLEGGPLVRGRRARDVANATGAFLESHLFTDVVHGRAGTSASPPALEVEALGRERCLLSWDQGSVELSRRHSDILVCLLENPAGMYAAELAAALFEGEVLLSSLRAEMARLRLLLPPHALASKPYRVMATTTCDWRNVLAGLAEDDVAGALQAYAGPLLGRSQSPSVADARDRVERRLRSAVLASANLAFAQAWTATSWGSGDIEMWRRLAESSRPGPCSVLALAELEALHAELAAPG